MLAGIEEAVRLREERACGEEREDGGIREKMTAMDNLVEGLFDYAGLYPPASLDLQCVALNYLNYCRDAHAQALARLVVDLDRVEKLREIAGDRFKEMRLTVVSQPTSQWQKLHRILDEGAPIEAVEIKVAAPSEVDCIARHLPMDLPAYFEVPFDSSKAELLNAVCTAGANVKLRMGGVGAETFPSSQAIADMLQAIAERHLSFKATAGLHHPIRSQHPFTHEPSSASGMMHGFVNLCCAASFVHLGGEATNAAQILEEADPQAWQITPEHIAWRNLKWSAEQLHETRREFFSSIGSCSFTEPMEDLETLGWL